MFTHNLDPVLFEFSLITIRWYSLAYIFGILIGWWYGKKVLVKKFSKYDRNFELKDFDDLVTFIIISIVVGGRLGYIIFYNFNYYVTNPIDIFKIWEGGMSFHGGLIGIIIGVYFFSIKRNIKFFVILDIIACVSPIGIFLGRLANFINGELVGKPTNILWGVVFPNIDMLPRHPSQIYQAILEGLVLFIILNYISNLKNYILGTCSSLFLIFYGFLRIFSEYFREPDVQIGYLFNLFSMGTFLSIIMIFIGIVVYNFFRKKNEF